MALITCKNCGRPVSDKAPACPHCGAEIEPAATQARPEPGAEFVPDTEECDKPTISPVVAIIAIAIIAIGALAGYYLYQQEMARQRAEFVRDSLAQVERERLAAEQARIAAEKAVMIAPQVPVVNGYYSLDDCPNTHKGLKVKLVFSDMELVRADVKRNGVLLQTLLDEQSASGIDGYEISPVFLDANFDGFVDIWIGPGSDRTHNALFLWNNSEGRFDRALNDGEDVFNGYYEFSPENKTVFVHNRAGAGDWFVTKLVWDGTNLSSKEELEFVESRSSFGSIGVENYYTIRSSKTKTVIASTDHRNNLPAEWQTLVPEEPQEDEYYAENDGYYNNDPSPNTQSSGSNVPAWLEQAEEKVAEDSQELLAMVRAGRVHPLNVMRIKQAMESNLPQIVSYYSEHGNYEKVAYYRRLAGALDEIFRQLQI